MVWSVGPTTDTVGLSFLALFIGTSTDSIARCAGSTERVRVAAHPAAGRQLKEGEDVALTGVEEDVHARVGFLGRGTSFSAMARMKRMSVLLVPLDGFLGVPGNGRRRGGCV